MWCGDMYEVSQLGSIFFATLELNEKRQRYCMTSERWPESCLILCVRAGMQPYQCLCVSQMTDSVAGLVQWQQ